MMQLFVMLPSEHMAQDCHNNKSNNDNTKNISRTAQSCTDLKYIQKD